MIEVLKAIDWRDHALRMGIFLFACIFLGYAYWVHGQKYESFTRAQSQLQLQKSKNRNAQSQMEIYDTYFPQYETLAEKGLVGRNFRLQWIENLKQISELYRLPGIDFTLHNAEDATESSEHYFSEQLPFKTTKMDLNLDLLHEGDWYNLLLYLHQNAPGLFSAEECELARVSEGKNQYGGLNAKCSLKWYTMKDITQLTEGV